MSEKRIEQTWPSNGILCDTRTESVAVYLEEAVQMLANHINELHERIEELEAKVSPPFQGAYRHLCRPHDNDIGVGETVEKPEPLDPLNAYMKQHQPKPGGIICLDNDGNPICTEPTCKCDFKKPEKKE